MLELATTLCVLPWDIFIFQSVYFLFCFYQNLIPFCYPFIYKTIAFSKIKLLFVTPSFENNCFFHKFNCLNTPESGLSVPLFEYLWEPCPWPSCHGSEPEMQYFPVLIAPNISGCCRRKHRQRQVNMSRIFPQTENG